MKTRMYLLAIGLLALSTVAMTAEARAECKVLDAVPTYTAGQLKDHTCTTSGYVNFNLASGTLTGLGTATAAAPTLSEGAAASFSFDLAGNTRFTLGTLISGEDQTNNLLMTSGGVARITTLGSVTSATTSTPALIPTGAKALMGQIINATSETKAITATVYGNWTNSTTGGIEICRIELPSTATTLQLQGLCPISVNAIPFTYWYYTVNVYTSASAAPFTIWPMF